MLGSLAKQCKVSIVQCFGLKPLDVLASDVPRRCSARTRRLLERRHREQRNWIYYLVNPASDDGRDNWPASARANLADSDEACIGQDTARANGRGSLRRVQSRPGHITPRGWRKAKSKQAFKGPRRRHESRGLPRMQDTGDWNKLVGSRLGRLPLIGSRQGWLRHSQQRGSEQGLFAGRCTRRRGEVVRRLQCQCAIDETGRPAFGSLTSK